MVRLASVAVALLVVSAPASGAAAASNRLVGDELCAFAVRAANAVQGSLGSDRQAARARSAVGVISDSLAGASVVDDRSAQYADHLRREAQALGAVAVEAPRDEGLARVAVAAAIDEAEGLYPGDRPVWLSGRGARTCGYVDPPRPVEAAVPSYGSFSIHTVVSRPDPPSTFGFGTTTTTITVPADYPPVRALLAFRPGHPVYDEALNDLLGLTGGLFFDDSTFYYVRSLPVVRLHDRVAEVRVQTRDAQPWSTEAGPQEAGRTTFTLSRPSGRRGVAGSITMSLSRAALSVRPPPREIAQDGALTWQVRPGRPIDLRVSLPFARSSIASRIRNRSGNWIWLYPADPWLAELLPLFLLAWALPRKREQRSVAVARATSHARSGIAVMLALALSGVAAFWLYWAGNYFRTGEFDVTAHAVAMSLILLSAAAFFETARRSAAPNERRSSSHRRRFLFIVVLVGALAATPFVADAPSDRMFSLPAHPWLAWLVLAGGLLLVLTVTFTLLAGVAAPLVAAGDQVAAVRTTGRAGVSVARPARPEPRVNHSTFVLLAAGAAAVFVLVHWLLSARDGWSRASQAGPLDHFPRAPMWPAGIQQMLATYPQDILSSFVQILPYVALLGLVAVVAAARDPGSGVLVLDMEPWMRRAAAVVFAGFVVGTQGSIASLRVAAPAAFVIGLLLMYFFPWSRRSEAAAGVGEASETPDVEAAGPQSPAGPGRVLLAPGPGTNWWENLTAGLFIGAALAVLPFGFYLYVFLAHLNQTLQYNTYFSLIYALVGIFTELAFWLSAAGVTALLYPYLPGRNGPVRGLTVAAMYILSIATAALVLHERVDPRWPFRSFELVLFLLLLGMALDLRTIRRLGGSWRELWDYYEVTRYQGIAVYLVPVVLALIGIGQQITSGHAQSAIVEIIKSFTAVPGLGK